MDLQHILNHTQDNLDPSSPNANTAPHCESPSNEDLTSFNSFTHPRSFRQRRRALSTVTFKLVEPSGPSERPENMGTFSNRFDCYPLSYKDAVFSESGRRRWREGISPQGKDSNAAALASNSTSSAEPPNSQANGFALASGPEKADLANLKPSSQRNNRKTKQLGVRRASAEKRMVLEAVRQKKAMDAAAKGRSKKIITIPYRRNQPKTTHLSPEMLHAAGILISLYRGESPRSLKPMYPPDHVMHSHTGYWRLESKRHRVRPVNPFIRGQAFMSPFLELPICLRSAIFSSIWNDVDRNWLQEYSRLHESLEFHYKTSKSDAPFTQYTIDYFREWSDKDFANIVYHGLSSPAFDAAVLRSLGYGHITLKLKQRDMELPSQSKSTDSNMDVSGRNNSAELISFITRPMPGAKARTFRAVQRPIHRN